MARGRAEAVRDLRRVWSVTAALGADEMCPAVGFSSVKRVRRKCLVAEPNPRSLSMSPFAPDFPDLEFETFQIVHVPLLTGWTVGGRAGIPAILILVGFSVRMGFPLILFKCGLRRRKTS